MFVKNPFHSQPYDCLLDTHETYVVNLVLLKTMMPFARHKHEFFEK